MASLAESKVKASPRIDPDHMTKYIYLPLSKILWVFSKPSAFELVVESFAIWILQYHYSFCLPLEAAYTTVVAVAGVGGC